MSSEERTFWGKYKKIIIGVLVIVVCFLFAFPFIYYGYDNVSDFTKGMLGTLVGTLIGACVGGFFTLKGSLAINENAQKAQNAIRRKNVIFKPLYDELKEIHDEILKKNPCPRTIAFEKRQQHLLKYPQYTVWGRIKNDTRFFEVPTELKNAMESLYTAIDSYQEKRQNAVDALDKIYKDSIQKITEIKIEIGRRICVGDTILSDVLQENRGKNSLFWWSDKTFSLDEEELLWGEIIKMARINEELKQCKEAKSIWNAAEENALNLLGTYIETITKKYED